MASVLVRAPQGLNRAVLLQNFARFGSATRHQSTSNSQDVNWVFLGPPGVGKGTYASRIAKAFGVPHIATGDLIRNEIKAESALGKEMKEIVSQGKLLPDEVVLKVLQQRLAEGKKNGERGYILDGFPRTRAQAESLLTFTKVNLALNLALREEVLVEKCMGRRMCKHCGKNYNIADIHLHASEGRPEIVMPPLNAPAECAPHLEIRDDDKEDVIRKRLKIYFDEALPVEECFKEKKLLVDFEITGGIPETLPVLMKALAPFATPVNEAKV